VWRTSINSFRKQQRDLNKPTENNKLDAWGDHVEEYSKRQKQLHQELVNRKLMEQELKNTMTEKTNITDDDSNIQTQPDLIWTERKPNNITWTENKRWMAAIIITLGTVGFMSGLYMMGWLLNVLVGTLVLWLVIMIISLVKHLVDELIDEW
jgi:membrane-bound ClpP family serine protease